jgi:mannose-6-phosphate isomerase-like protein (cupin superfamily)
MQIVHGDAVFRVAPGASPDYNSNNPLLRVLQMVERAGLAAERENYLMGSVQYLFPFEFLELWGPAAPASDVLDPRAQDSKTDFQKQNVRDFRAGDCHLVRGYASVDGWTGPFLRLSYRGGPDSRLSSASGHKLGERIKLWARVGALATEELLEVPYVPRTDRYELELWGYPGNELRERLDAKGREALERGELVARPDLVPGQLSDFERDALAERYVVQVAPGHAMHPVLPLHVEAAWADFGERFWDSREGANYQYEFNMVLRGWNHYLGVGISPNPHGGVGFLEYRNLLSNYGRYAGSGELGRSLQSWNFDATGRKDQAIRSEAFFSVDYMDLHLLKSRCGIGLHRHRDNQEIFFMMEGRAYMVVGDWCKMPARERCFEVRTLHSGELAMLKGGNLHGLMNAMDEDISLFMFGGYD